MSNVQHIFNFDGNPSIAPLTISAHAFNTQTKQHYISKGTASSFDWAPQVTGFGKPVIDSTVDQLLSLGNNDTKLWAGQLVVVYPSLDDLPGMSPYIFQLNDLVFSGLDEQNFYGNMEFSLLNLSGTTIQPQLGANGELIVSSTDDLIQSGGTDAVINPNSLVHFKLIQYVDDITYTWLTWGDYNQGSLPF